MQALAELSKLADTLSNPYIEHWKEEGGKVIGYYCTYVPVELIHAAGMLPYRVRATGSTSTALGDLYSDPMMCTFTRHSLDHALRGEYKFLDGLVAAFSCDHIRRMFDAWSYGKVETGRPPFYLRFLSVPFKADDLAVEWLTGELERFRQSLQKHFQVTITDDDLRRSIKAYNEKRTLLKSLYELRKGEAPPVTGAEVLKLAIASTAMPVEEFNRLMHKLLDEVQSRDGFSDYRARLLMVGGELEDPAYIEAFEELGGLVVMDYLCYGVRDFWDLVDENAEPLAALANRYLYRLTCPRNMGHRERVEFINSMVKEFEADGIVVERMKYCDAWGGESALLRWTERKADIPCIVLEREFLMAGAGQLRTRAQAFLEMLRER